MITISQNCPFIAQWNENNVTLNPNQGGTLWKIARKITALFFYLPNCVLATCLNPTKETPFYSSSKLKTNYGHFNKKIITPDHVHLVANIHLVENAQPITPTVILFNPLGTSDFIHEALTLNLTKRSCNVVTFNYRGLGRTRRAKDFVVDGESIYQYVTQELGTQKNHVHFFGFSLGGVLAAQVKALHPECEGKYVGDRPFKSLFSLITEICCIKKLGQVVKKITACVTALLLAYPIYLLGWEWDGQKALAQIKGARRIIYHPHDFLVPFEASLASCCPPQQVIRLQANGTGPSTHFSTLDRHYTHHTSALMTIADFLSNSKTVY